MSTARPTTDQEPLAMLLSGGVDSSVALALLRRAGHEVRAFYLKIWLEDELAGLGECPWDEDLRFARAVCARLGVELEVISLQHEYHARVVRHALDELRAGRTPSPDVLCNQRVKFGAFVDHLAGRGIGRIASGHYARLDRETAGAVALRRGVDPVKDQTYFLYRLDRDQLERCLFPLGGRTKTEVRRLAAELGLPNRDRADSQGICFLGKIRYDDFVRSYLGERPGEIRDVDGGHRLGHHRGYWFHTVGQRRGLGLHGGPWYVVGKDVDKDVVWVAHGDRLAAHRRHRFRLVDPHWLAAPPTQPVALGVKLRHSPTTAPCRLEPTADGYVVHLERPDPGVADGQSAVLYDGDLCLGGGYVDTQTSRW